MTKATQTAAWLGISGILWLLLWTGAVPTSDFVQHDIVPVLPWWSLVTFGAYALGTLGYDVLTFNDKPEKYQELMQQVKQARRELQAEGVSVN